MAEQSAPNVPLAPSAPSHPHVHDQVSTREDHRAECKTMMDIARQLRGGAVVDNQVVRLMHFTEEDVRAMAAALEQCVQRLESVQTEQRHPAQPESKK